jgi:hypothetical protein
MAFGHSTPAPPPFPARRAGMKALAVQLLAVLEAHPAPA